MNPYRQDLPRTLEGLGVHAEPVDAIVPTYLYRFRRSGQFSPQKS